MLSPPGGEATGFAGLAGCAGGDAIASFWSRAVSGGLSGSNPKKGELQSRSLAFGEDATGGVGGVLAAFGGLMTGGGTGGDAGLSFRCLLLLLPT